MPDPAESAACFEPPTYTLRLTRLGDNRLGVMMALRTLRPDLDPKAAKTLIDGETPLVLMEEVRHWDAPGVRRLFEVAGASVEFIDYYGRAT